MPATYTLKGKVKDATMGTPVPNVLVKIVGGTLNFGNQIFTATVYGQIPAGQDPAPGSYIDTITVTVNY